jgi:elongation factor P
VIKAGQISKGMFLLMKEEPCLVVEREFVNPGKGQAFVRLRLKGLRTGRSIQQTFKTPDNVEDIHVDMRPAQYMYSDDESFHFMDTENYEQIAVDKDGLEDRQHWLKEGTAYDLIIYEGKAIDIKVPFKVVLTVTQASVGLKGDTATGATKPVTIETGFTVKVPLFIKEGDRVLINTETGEYVERVN